MTLILPNQIEKLREKKGFSRKELAKKINVTENHMYKIENHKKPLTLTKAVMIANVLNVTLNDIFLQNKSSE